MDNQKTGQEPSADFVLGFNESYLLAQNMPELAEQLVKGINSNSERSMGFKKGYDQYVLENDKQHTLTWLETPDKDEPNDREVGKDGLDHERD